MNNGKICVSVCAATAAELVEQIKRAEDLADVIEIRFDCFNENELKTALEKLKELNVRKPFLATFRPKEQGGKRDLSLSERLKFFEAFLLNNKNKNYFVDFEADLHLKLNIELKNKIVSSHDFTSVPEDFDLNVAFDLLKQNTGTLKIAAQADDLSDTIRIWKLLEKAKTENKQIIPIAMGESGKWTRILGLAHGAFMTYASLDAESETAPGQVSARDLIEVYRAKELNETTDVYGILGSNTSVSMSPYIHNMAFAFHDLNAVFVPLQVNNLDEFMRRMVLPATREIELNFKGFSVTLPHKQAIIKHLDGLDETAAKIGAVNTVKITDGKLYGYNTDAPGFIEPLLNSYGDLTGAKVAVLGAGGAARAVVYALKTAGADVTIFARDLTKAESLAADFKVESRELSKTEDQKPKTDFSDFDILVNTTPLGMKGKADGETPALAEHLKGLHLVYDLVYIPFQTPLMTEADIAEVPKIGGLAMLIAQAIEQQRIWTGLAAPMKEMSRAVLKRIA